MLRSKRQAADRASGRYETVAVRVARPDDQSTIRRIAALDDKPVPMGRVLVAEADGEVIAALGNGAMAVAHPFRWTRDVVTLLEMRSLQMQTGHA